MGMHNKETYTRVCAHIDMRIRKIRTHNMHMHSSLISELHCIHLQVHIHVDLI